MVSCCPAWSASGAGTASRHHSFLSLPFVVPWQILARILGMGPTIYAVRWKKNIYLGMAVHCTLNLLGLVLVTNLLLARL